jgi:inositol-1,3,4-trisphosphate 5/6-kinase/inositol-tetrakisphosphate 1-kinase
MFLYPSQLTVNSASQHGLQIVHVDLDDPMALQGNFDLIVHKLTDLIAAATKGNVEARQQLDGFEQYTKAHPRTVILDPLAQVDRLMDRRNTFDVLKACQTAHTLAYPDASEPLFYLPNHICLPNIHATFSSQHLHFPVSTVKERLYILRLHKPCILSNK